MYLYLEKLLIIPNEESDVVKNILFLTTIYSRASVTRTITIFQMSPDVFPYMQTQTDDNKTHETSSQQYTFISGLLPNL